VLATTSRGPWFGDHEWSVRVLPWCSRPGERLAQPADQLDGVREHPVVVTDLESTLAEPSSAGSFGSDELTGLPEPVRRYFTAAIAPGAPLAVSVRLSMRGRIKLGRWWPFSADEVLHPHRGFVWRARIAGALTGFDRYAAGRGEMDWRLAGLVKVMHADGPDVSRSAAERAGAEAIWLPTALLPRFGVRWEALDDQQIRASYNTDGKPLLTTFAINADGRIRSFGFDRWGDPDQTGAWAQHPCGGEVTASTTFDGLTIPAAGRFGWFHGTDRWHEGEFIRFQITKLDPVNN
jgi:hypothetical protein